MNIEGIMKIKKNTHNLLINERFSISSKKGNGVLTRKIWEDDNKNITRYSLAYINLNITQDDNGRVLGYDNAHGYHHKHLLGNITPIEFTSFEDIEARFEKEYEELHNEHSQKKN